MAAGNPDASMTGVQEGNFGTCVDALSNTHAHPYIFSFPVRLIFSFCSHLSKLWHSFGVTWFFLGHTVYDDQVF